MNPRLLKTTGYCALACALLIAALFFWVDRPVDLAASGLKGGVLYKAAKTICLAADHDFFNVALFTALLYCGVAALGRGLTPGLRLCLYCCLAVALVMVIGETLKWFFGRYRPEMLFSHGLYGFSFFADKGGMHSFPSGHTMRIFSAATALSMVWPRARVWLLCFAALVGVGRVIVTRHYPSDVVAGVFVGVFCALWVWQIMMAGAQGKESASMMTKPG